MGKGKMPSITIVGCGPGKKSYATPAAIKAIMKADLLIGARRLLNEFGNGKNSIAYDSVTGTIQSIKNNKDKKIAVLVSGDPGFYSLTSLIIKEFAKYKITVIPGICSLIYAFDRLCIPWQDARLLSAHKSLPDDLGLYISENHKLGILTSPQNNAAQLVRKIKKSVAKNYQFFVGQNLTYKNEELREYKYEELCSSSTAVLTVLIIIRKEKV